MTTEAKLASPLKIGLLAVASVWFLFSFHELFKAMVNINEYLYMGGGGQGATAWWVMVTDYSGAVGLIARTIAGIVAVAAVAMYLKKGTASSSTRKILQFVLVAEAIYWLSLLLSGIWGLLPIELAYGAGSASTGLNWSLGFVIETGLPCIVESIAVPIVLLKLVSELRPNRPPKNAIKWALIAGFVYIFVFWLDNTGNWLYQVFYSRKPIEYLTTNPENLLSFGLTVFGLLALAVFAAVYAKKSAGTETVENLNLKTAGAIITLLGLYFLWNYLTWIVFGRDALWSNWYAWILGHNMNLWVLCIPLVGLPLLFAQKPKEKQA